MKKILLLMTMVLLLAAEGFSQAPGILNYQGVARNSVGNVLVNQNISLRLTIRNLTAAGAVVYQESRAVTTNPFGLFNVQLGSPGASGVTGTIPGVNWAVGAKFIQVEIDPNGGSSFINIGTAQLASVPYSLFATTAGDLILPFNKTQNDNGTLFKITNSGTNSGSTALEGLTNSTAGNANAIIGTVTSTAPGGFSAGVRGINNGTGGSGIGVYGSQAGSGWGVYGTTPSGIGVYGNTTSGTGVSGNTTSGTGVSGNSTSGAGVFGQSNTGVAGIFTITNAASTADALQANTTGTGWAATITSSNATPRALRTTGGLRFTGINEANNRILTSDASGNATWQNPAVVGIVTGSGTLDRVPKWTPNGTNLGDSRIEDRAGTLPIGINTPGGYTYTSVQPGLEMTNSAALLQTRIVLRDQSDGGDVQGFIDARTSPTATVSAMQLGTLTNHPITFFGNGVNMGRWSAAGNLGIGTTAGVDPTAKLQVNNAGTNITGLFSNTNVANDENVLQVLSDNITSTGFTNSFGVYGRRGPVPAVNAAPTAATTAFFVKQDGNALAGYSQTGIGTFGITNTGTALQGFALTAAAYALQTFGRVQITGQGAGLNKILTSDATGNATWQTLGGGVGVGGAGTLNFVSKWTPDGSNLGNSQIFDDGTNVGLGTITPTEKFEINSPGVSIGFKNEGTDPGILLNSTLPTGIERIYFGSGSNARIFFNNSGLFTNHLLLTSNFAGNTPDISINKANTNVGIGRVNAGAKLHVDGSIDLNQTIGVGNFGHQAFLAQTSSTATATTSRSIIGYAANSTSENHSVFAYANGGGTASNAGVFSLAIAATTGNNFGYYANVANSTNANIGIQVNVPNGPNDRAGVFVGKVQIADGTQAAGRIFTSDASGTGSWQTAAAAGVVSGSGTLNYVPKWTPDGVTVGNSRISDDGSFFGFNSTINRDAFGENGITLENTSSTRSALSLYNNFNGNAVSGYFDVRDGAYQGIQFGTQSNHPIKFFTNNFAGNTAILMGTDGALKIGATGNADFATAKLDVAGTFKLADGTEGAGKVLTSDASGNASWQGPVSISAEYLLAGLNVPSGANVIINNWSTVTNEDGGANYNPVTGEYTISVSGYYDINASVNWLNFSTPGARARLYVQVNGSRMTYETQEPSSGNGNISVHYARRLNAGDVVRFEVNHTTANNEVLDPIGYGTTFDIHLVHR